MIPAKRDIVTINDLSKSEIEEIFDLTDEYLQTMSRAGAATDIPVRGRIEEASGFVLATLFYEPSTRTRLSFESAMIRLGGSVLGTTDPVNSSVAKGESIADTVRVIQNYADLIVIRHNYGGAARAAAEYADIPIINGGDGSHEHPTQTLCDIYTLRQELGKAGKSLDDITVLIVGDLKNGRTVHSLVYALALFGANIVTMPASGLDLPGHVGSRVRAEFGYACLARDEIPDIGGNYPRIAAIFVAPPRAEEPGRCARAGVEKSRLEAILNNIDACYVTRLQDERLLKHEKLVGDYPIIDRKFLSEKQYTHTLVLHPLPRVDELSYDLDADPRALYFKQMAYSVPIRMALISKVLGIRPFDRRAEPGSRSQLREYAGNEGIRCENPRCVTNLEHKYLSGKFFVVDELPLMLRCQYCDTPASPHFIGNSTTKIFSCLPADTRLSNLVLPDTVLFSTEAQASTAGYRAEPAASGCGKRQVA
jgi:aspartate carbamoyltransferase catalytic subunit